MYKFFIVGLLIVVHGSFANAKLYRYSENGKTHFSQTLTKKHTDMGYDELDNNYRLIKTVAPYNHNQVKEKKVEDVEAQKIRAAEQAIHDSLFRKFDSSSRAKRKRVDLLKSFKSERLFAKKQLLRVKVELNKILDKASDREKSGKPISDSLKQQISTQKEVLTASQSSFTALLDSQNTSLNAITLDIRTLRKYENASK